MGVGAFVIGLSQISSFLSLTVVDFFIKLCRHVHDGKRMKSIDFGGQRSKVKVTMDIYGSKLVNMIET